MILILSMEVLAFLTRIHLSLKNYEFRLQEIMKEHKFAPPLKERP